MKEVHPTASYCRAPGWAENQTLVIDAGPCLKDDPSCKRFTPLGVISRWLMKPTLGSFQMQEKMIV